MDVAEPYSHTASDEQDSVTPGIASWTLGQN